MIKKIVIRILKKLGYSLVKIKTVTPEEVRAHKERGERIINAISPSYTVLQGPFAGLVYPTIDITEATLVPKISGSYESQLHDIVYRIIGTDYSDIVDVGCAEGYYAVGFAMRMPDTLIHAFDINKDDLEFCRQMALKNNVANISFNSYCSPETLLKMADKRKLLVFCDAEGFELELFTPAVIAKLKNASFLIELHDNVNPTISTLLKERFSATHTIEIVNNRQTDQASFYSGLKELSAEDKLYAVMEHRGGYFENCFMEWAFITPA